MDLNRIEAALRAGPVDAAPRVTVSRATDAPDSTGPVLYRLRRQPGPRDRRLVPSAAVAIALALVVGAVAIPRGTTEPASAPSAGSGVTSGATQARSSAPTSDAPPPSSVAPRVHDEGSDGAFSLTITTPRGRYAPEEPIDIRTSLTYLGPLRSTRASGSGSGLVGFSVEEIGGHRRLEAVGTADCAPYTFNRDETWQIAFQKSGGFSSSDPDAAFMRAYFAEPMLRLPAGTWRITAQLDVSVPGGCTGSAHKVTASVIVRVDPSTGAAATPVPTPTRTPRTSPVASSGLLRVWPASPRVPVGTTQPLELYTHCGFDSSLIDFDGRLWDPVDPRHAPAFDNPIDVGTITLTSPSTARFIDPAGRELQLRPLPGSKDIPLCM